MRAIIVEDEKRSLMFLHNLIKEFCPELNVIGHAQTVDDAWNLLQVEKVDLVFLDIQLRGENSFNLLEKFGGNIPFSIIFTTAYEHYAVRAIRYSAIDYILKPIDLGELKNAIQRVKQKTEQDVSLSKKLDILLHNFQAINSGNQQIVISTFSGYHFLRLNEIIYCQADGPYTTLFLKDTNQLIVSRSLKEFEETLPEDMFCRIHHSTLINLYEIKIYKKSDGGSIIMSDKTELPVSRSRREELSKRVAKLVF